MACPYCDGHEATGRAIGVLAGSLAGLHKAHLLRSYSDDITVFAALAGPVPELDRLVLEERGMHVETRPVTSVVAAASERVAAAARSDTGKVRADHDLGAARAQTPGGPQPTEEP